MTFADWVAQHSAPSEFLLNVLNALADAGRQPLDYWLRQRFAADRPLA